jgi:hypothetical protein
MEATHLPPVDVDAPPAPDLERTSAGIPDDVPAALPEVVVCRYCRTPAAPGERLCARCGVRLPVLPLAVPESDQGVQLRICSCGATVRPDAALCPTCGARLR